MWLLFVWLTATERSFVILYIFIPLYIDELTSIKFFIKSL